MILDKDAFSSGQIGSKIWLCEELEKIGWSSNTTYVYGGWYGVLSFLILSRGKFQVQRIRSIDIDPTCKTNADLLNEYWVWQEWKFKALTEDCNVIKPEGDLIINTSTEHFTTKQWFDNIPKGTKVILQGNDMPHADHYVHSETLENFVNEYPLTNLVFKGEKEFIYPTWQFKRYMIIGIK